MKLIDFILPSVSLGAYCRGGPNPDAPLNLSPILDQEPTFVKEVENGRLYTVNTGNNDVTIAHVFGTPMEMGRAQGELLGDTINTFINGLFDYIIDEITHELNDFAPNLPDDFIEDVVQGGLDWAMDRTINITEPYTPDYFNQEIEGLARATGMSAHKLKQVHMFGEITKGACSMFGIWNEALASGEGLLQGRTLDWDMNGPFRDYPHITVYHPAEGWGNDFINLGWPGWIGSLTGMNDQLMGISEIGASYADHTFGRESRHGIPFTYLLRDILQWDKSLDDTKMRVKTADRTCNLILGVGDGKINEMNSIRYSYSAADFFDDKTLEPGPWCIEEVQPCDWMPLIENVVYHGMDWNCPTYTRRLSEEINKKWGNITPENAISDIIARTCTGDVHNAVYDLTQNDFYFAVASPHGADSSTKQAYKNSYYKLDADKLFAEERPQL